MIFNKFIEKYKKASDTGFSKRDYNRLLGFSPFVSKTELASLEKTLKFDLVLLSHIPLGELAYGLRIIPDLPWSSWPVYQIFDYRDAILFAPSIQSLLAAFQFKKINFSQKNWEKAKDNDPALFEIAAPLLKLFGGEEKIKQIRSYFKEKEFTNYSGEAKEERIRYFLGLMDNSLQFESFAMAIEKMQQTEDFMPEINQDFGIYTPWVFNAAAAKVTFAYTQKNTGQAIAVLEKSLAQPDGFDARSALPTFRPQLGIESKNNNAHLAFLRISLGSIPKSISENPLFHAINQLHKKESSYTGTAHLEAAAIYDTELRQPKAAFDALSSGAYWASYNLPEALPEIKKQALYLCKREGWEDAAQALSY